MGYITEEDIGVVQKILDKNRAIVVVTNRGECNTCVSRKSCTIFGRNDKSLIEVTYTDDLKEGDSVIILIEPSKKIISSILVFLLPLILMFVFYLIGIKLLKSELLGFAISLIGLVFSYYMTFFLIKKSKWINNYLPKVVKIKSEE